MQIKFLKDCRWCINHKPVDFKKDQIAEVDEAIAVKMLDAKYGVHALTADKKASDAEAKAKEEAESEAKAEAEKMLDKMKEDVEAAIEGKTADQSFEVVAHYAKNVRESEDTPELARSALLDYLEGKRAELVTASEDEKKATDAEENKKKKPVENKGGGKGKGKNKSGKK